MESIVKLVETQFKEFQKVPLYEAFTQQAAAWMWNILLEEEDPEVFVRDFFFPEEEAKIVEMVRAIREDIQGKEAIPMPEFSLSSKNEKKEKSSKSSKKSSKNSPKIHNPLTGRDIVLGGAAFKKYRKQGYFLEDGTPTKKALDEAKLKEEAKATTKKTPSSSAVSKRRSSEDSEEEEDPEKTEELEEPPVPTESVALEEIPEKAPSSRRKASSEGMKILNPRTGKKITKGGKVHQQLVKEKVLPDSSLE